MAGQPSEQESSVENREGHLSARGAGGCCLGSALSPLAHHWTRQGVCGEISAQMTPGRSCRQGTKKEQQLILRYVDGIATIILQRITSHLQELLA